MKTRKKQIIIIAVCAVVLAGLIAVVALILSGSSQTKAFMTYQPIEDKKLDSCTVCENEQFSLQWDQKNKRVILYDKEHEIRWSSTPESMLDNNPIETGRKNHPQVDSPLYVTYFDNVSFAEKTAYAATSAVKNGTVSAEKTENGLSVTYDFKTEEIAVTVDYILREDNLLVTVDTEKIREGEDNIVTEVKVAPFFCSVENNTEDSYLFVPSGSGALIYSDVQLAAGTTTAEKVYGEDNTIDKKADFVQYQAVRLPVYGSVSGNRGVCAIIEEGAEGANICSVSNNDGMGYGAVYASFYTRGYDMIDTPSGFVSVAPRSKLFSEPITDQTYSVAFYPFCKEDASYVDMAEIYRDYLKREHEFENYASVAQQQAVNVSIIGAVEGKEFVFGIPYSKLYVATSISEAADIIRSVREIAGDVNVSLDGFTTSGVNVGEPAGGLALASKAGSYKELKKLYETYRDTDTTLFLNYDSVRFNDSGLGISTFWNSAVTTNGKQATLTFKSQETGMEDNNQQEYKLVSRNSLEKLNQKILKKASKKGVEGISLGTLSNMAYADYNNDAYYAALGMGKQVSDILKTYRKNQIAVMSQDANAYVAWNSDYIGNVPTSSSNYESYDVDVPFYEIVFKGYVPMSAESINLSADSDKALLKVLESGIGLNVTVLENYDDEFINSMERKLYGTNKEQVLTLLQTLKEEGVYDILNDLKETQITEHSVLNEYVRRTVFSNGMVVFVNYGDTTYEAGPVVVEPNAYYVERQGVR